MKDFMMKNCLAWMAGFLVSQAYSVLDWQAWAWIFAFALMVTIRDKHYGVGYGQPKE